MHIDHLGLLDEATFIASPNFDERPDPQDISMVVIHNISLPPKQYGGQGIVQLFTNQLNPSEHPYYTEIHQLRVSSHFLIRRDGDIVQFVSCLNRAWHAGVSHWQGRERCNDFSIGIELEGCDEEAFTQPQYDQLYLLMQTIQHTYAIQDVVGHSDIAPGRKTDPGPYFDWAQLQDLVPAR